MEFKASAMARQDYLAAKKRKRPNAAFGRNQKILSRRKEFEK